MNQTTTRDSLFRQPLRLATAGLAVLTLALGAAAGHEHLWAADQPAATPAAAMAAPATAAPRVVENPAVPLAPSYSAIVDRVAPAVVTVRVEKRAEATQTSLPEELAPFFGRQFRGTPRPRRESGLGSGVIIRDDGYILTNNHVAGGADRIRVDLADGRSLAARVVGTDEASDLAVIKVDATGLPTVAYGDSEHARVGDVVLAFGNPLGVGQTVTMGIVSAKGRATGVGDGSYEDFLQTDAPINQGNSGGALVNLQGELLGINAQILSPSGGNIGLGFAIPSGMARAVAEQLIKEGVVHRAKLGVTVQRVTPELADSLGLSNTRGALVSSLEAGSPGAKAGLKEGDVIVELDGQPVTDSNSLRNRVASLAPNTTVNLKVLRDGKPTSISATVVERESEKARASRSGDDDAEHTGRLGMSVTPLTPRVAAQLELPKTEKGLVITDVDPAGVAADAGLQPGDVVKKVNGREVESVQDLKSALDTHKDAPALVLVSRNGATVFVALPHAQS